MHLQSIASDLAIGDDVAFGQPIAKLGDANGFYSGANGSAHLHFQIRLDTSLPINANPYITTLTFNDALKYTSPSLFIDDRRSVIRLGLVRGSWVFFTPTAHAPSSTSFIQDLAAQRYSLNRAINSGLIAGVWEYRSGKWTRYTDISNLLFEKDIKYAFYSFVTGATLNVLTPGYTPAYRMDRAKIDIARAMSEEGIFTSFDTTTAEEILGWSSAWELRSMDGASILGTVRMFHATSKSNPLRRFTIYYHPRSGWTSWKIRPVNHTQ